MDPNAALAVILDETADPARREDALGGLIDWVDSGGFLPRLAPLDAPTFGGNTAARFWLRRRLEALEAAGFEESHDDPT